MKGCLLVVANFVSLGFALQPSGTAIFRMNYRHAVTILGERPNAVIAINEYFVNNR